MAVLVALIAQDSDATLYQRPYGQKTAGKHYRIDQEIR